MLSSLLKVTMEDAVVCCPGPPRAEALSPLAAITVNY